MPALDDDGDMKAEEVDDKDVGAKKLANESQPRLLASIFVYSTADKYDIPALKNLARSKFSTLAWEVGPHQDFSTVIQEVFEPALSSDDRLRGIVTEFCRQHVDDVLDEEQYQSILQTIAPLPFALMLHVKTTTDEAKVQQISENATQITNIQKHQSDHLNVWAHNVRALIASAKAGRKYCVCAQSEFDFVQVEHEQELRGVLRCVWCKEDYQLDAGSGGETKIRGG